jgi:hypothetical protein
MYLPRCLHFVTGCWEVCGTEAYFAPALYDSGRRRYMSVSLLVS